MPYSLHVNYSELHVVEFKELDAVNYTIALTY
jgi:hypothetical protein